MTSAILVALIAAAATVASTAVAVLAARGPLHRMDVVSRVLAGLPEDDPARTTLIEVLRRDAEEVSRAQQSPLNYFIALWAGLAAGAFVLSTFGAQIAKISPGLYLSLTWALVVVAGIAVTFIVALIAALVIRLVRWIRRRLPGRVPRQGLHSPPPDHSDVES